MRAFDKEDPRYHSDTEGMIGAKTAEELTVEQLNIGEELRAMSRKLMLMTVYTDLSGKHYLRIARAIGSVLKELGEEYRL